MNLEELADDAKKENIISVVAQMSKVDGKLHPNELIYLLKLGLSFGLSDETVREIIIKEENFIFIPKLEQDRITILYYLIFLMKADNEIQKNEEHLLHHYGLKLGFSPLMIENLIRVVKANLEVKLTPNALLDEIKKYLN